MAALTLTTPRLALRPFREDDWRALHLLDGDPEHVRFTSRAVSDEAGTRAHLAELLSYARQEPRRVFDFAVTRTGRDTWGQGYATEAAAAVLDFAFDSLALHRVYGDCDPRNLASARVMEKLGFTREAHLRENWWLKGEWCDSFLSARRPPKAGQTR